MTEDKNPGAGLHTSTFPDAHVFLDVVQGGFVWIIPKCPRCGRRHQHGGGGLVTRQVDPRASLGHRAAHCLHLNSGYILVEENREHTDQVLAGTRRG